MIYVFVLGSALVGRWVALRLGFSEIGATAASLVLLIWTGLPVVKYAIGRRILPGTFDPGEIRQSGNLGLDEYMEGIYRGRKHVEFGCWGCGIILKTGLLGIGLLIARLLSESKLSPVSGMLSSSGSFITLVIVWLGSWALFGQVRTLLDRRARTRATKELVTTISARHPGATRAQIDQYILTSTLLQVSSDAQLFDYIGTLFRKARSGGLDRQDALRQVVAGVLPFATEAEVTSLAGDSEGCAYHFADQFVRQMRYQGGVIPISVPHFDVWQAALRQDRQFQAIVSCDCAGCVSATGSGAPSCEEG